MLENQRLYVGSDTFCWCRRYLAEYVQRRGGDMKVQIHERGPLELRLVWYDVTAAKGLGSGQMSG